jgi:hypothetical protein
MDSSWRWRRAVAANPAHPGAAPTFHTDDPRNAQRMAPGEAFTSNTVEPERGYPVERIRDDDISVSADPRYAHPESRTALVLAGATAAPFIVFSGVVDHVSPAGNDSNVQFIYRDDAGRELGRSGADGWSNGPWRYRCKRVDAVNSSGGDSLVSVTGHYLPAARARAVMTDDLHARPAPGYVTTTDR